MAGISTRMNTLVGIFSVAMIGSVSLGYFAMNDQLATQQHVASLRETRAAAQTMRYDFADFNGWQTAYAFDVAHQGAKGSSRTSFLNAVARTRKDLTKLRQLSTSLPDDDQDLPTGVADRLDQFMRVQGTAIASAEDSGTTTLWANMGWA